MVEKLRVFQILFVVCFIVIIALAGVIAHRHIKEASTEEDPPIDESSEKFVRGAFDWRFRTRAEQSAFEKRFRARHEELAEVDDCTKLTAAKKFKRDVLGSRAMMPKPMATQNYVYHGCCRSEVVWITPDTAIDPQGQNLTLVQYGDDRQYFQSEDCCQMNPCSVACTCSQGTEEVTALVVNPKTGNGEAPYTVKEIIIPGCCKCLNS